jgi:hypothetical protein
MRAGAVRAAIGLAAAGAMLLAGYGSSASFASSASSAPPRSPAATVAQMKSAVNAASSVHLAGVLRDGGRAVGLDIGLIRSGEFAGTITDNGVPLILTDAGGKIYVKATPAFLKELKVSPALCSLMCGKYVELTAAQSAALAGDFTMQKLLASLTGKLPKFANAGTTTVRGQPAQVLRAPDGSMLEVAATGTPYPLRAVAKRHNGQLDFTQWNTVPRPVPPPANQVIDVSRLG